MNADKSSCVARLSVAWNININNAEVSVGIVTSLGFSMMSLKRGNDFSTDRNALISADALAPIVPANAHMTALSPSTSLLSTMTDALANERGEQNDNTALLG